MAFEPIYEVINCDYKKRLSAAQIVAECRLTPDSVKISKVLAISAEAAVDSFESLSGEANFSGSVSFKVIFVDEEGKNHCIDHSTPFHDKMTDGSITPSLKCMASAAVMDTDTVSVSPGEIRLATVVEITAEAILCERAEFLKSAGSDVYTQEEELPLCNKSADFKGDWSISEEVDPKFNIVKIMTCDSSGLMTAVKTGMDCVTVEGRIISIITMETEGGLIKTLSHTASFTEEIAAGGARSDDLADGAVYLNSASVTLDKDVSGEKDILRLDFKVSAAGAVFRTGSVKAVVDAFSVRNEIKISSESFPMTKFLLNKSYFDRVEGSATLELNMPEVDNILSVCASRLTITGAAALDNKIVLEGLVNTSVIYYNAAANSKNSIAVELPYSLTFNQEGSSENQVLIVKGIVGAGSAKIKRTNEIEISVEVCYNVSFYESSDAYVIKELTLGEERAQSKSAIAIYVTRGGETLWDVAKALMTTPELIMQQNPSLKLPLPSGTRVMVYKQLEAEF